MEKDRMKDYIDAHREEFDSLIPSDELWSKIAADLPDKESGKTVPLRYLWYTVGVAASIVLLMGVFVLAPSEENNQSAETSRQQHEEVSEAASFSLADVSAELAEVEYYYITEVNQKIEKVRQYEEGEAFLQDIEVLREEFDLLREEMGKGADRHRIVEAMIENYQLRLEILEDLLDALEENQATPIKTKRHEA